MAGLPGHINTKLVVSSAELCWLQPAVRASRALQSSACSAGLHSLSNYNLQRIRGLAAMLQYRLIKRPLYIQYKNFYHVNDFHYKNYWL